MDYPASFGLKSVIHEMKLVSGFNGELIDWPVNLIKTALSLENVIAIKEDSKNDDIAAVVFEECAKQGVTCVLAGGGKRRALKFADKGMQTWLNGTTMFFPQAIDKIYPAIMNQDKTLVSSYCEKIEDPFFKQIATKYGWHLAHKAALEYFGYGTRWERFPHAQLPDSEYSSLAPVFDLLEKNIDEFMEL